MLVEDFPYEIIKDPLNRVKVEDYYRRFVVQRYGRYGYGHFILACYAAFPAVVTPDLLYQMWLNFGDYLDQGQKQFIRRVAVADLLLSPLFREIRFETYEMSVEIRHALTAFLQRMTTAAGREDHSSLEKRVSLQNPLGLHPVEHLAYFLLQYLDTYGDRQTDPYHELQQWTANSYVNPKAAKDFLARKLNEARDATSELRYAKAITAVQERYELNLVKDKADIPPDFKKLANFAQGAQDLLFGRVQNAEELFQQIAERGWVQTESHIEGAIALKIHEQVAEKVVLSEEGAGPADTVYALLIGIDRYASGSGISDLSGCVAETEAVSTALEKLRQEGRIKLQLTRLNDADATHDRFDSELTELLAAARDEDHLFLFFVGQTEDTSDGKNSLLLYDSHHWGERVLTANRLQTILKENTFDPHILMIADSGRAWLDSGNPKHIFIASHTSNRDLPASGGALGAYLAGALPDATARESHRQFFRKMLTHFQKESGSRRRPQFYAHPAGASRPLFKKMDRALQLRNDLRRAGWKDAQEAAAQLGLTDPADTAGLAAALGAHLATKAAERTPLLLFVFSDPREEMPAQAGERAGLENLFQPLAEKWAIECRFESGLTIEGLKKLCCDPEFRNCIHLFHFSGKVTRKDTSDPSYGFLLQDGFLDFFTFLEWLDYQEEMKLAYLNACDANYMAEWMAQMAVVGSIGVSGTIPDQEAATSALLFYRRWAEGRKDAQAVFSEILSRQPTEGSSILEAFDFHFSNLPWAQPRLPATVFGGFRERERAKPPPSAALTESLYALIVGINDYPVPTHRLQGAVPDAGELRDFLADFCESEQRTFQPLVLLNEQATLKNVIEGFAHFEQARPGDVCVFYFAGLGSQMNAPPEFWKTDADRLLETLVCYDSRLPGGRDLTDKELSYLLWKYGKGREEDLHFVSILDCCFSGTITRGVAIRPAGGLTSRMADKNSNNLRFSDLFGAEEFLRMEDGSIRFPVGDFISLSAAQSNESAYETTIGGAPRGIFTKALLDVFQQSNLRFLSYADLVSRVYGRVQNYTGEQTPQRPRVDALGSASARSVVLKARKERTSRNYILYDKKEGWIVDLGAIHGLQPGARLAVDVNGQEVGLEVRSVAPGRSILEPDGKLDRSSRYLIRRIDLRSPLLAIGFHPDLEPQTRSILEKAVRGSDRLQLDQSAAQYWMGLDPDRGYILTRPGMELPVFRGIGPDAIEPVALFIDNVEKVAHWEYVRTLANPLSPVEVDAWVEVELAEVVEHHDYLNVVKAENRSVDEEAVFPYRYRNGQWTEPALQLRVKNKHNSELWIAGLYISEDFSITDAFMPVRAVRPGEEPYRFTDEQDNDIIPLWLPDALHSWGVTEITNRIKIIVSSERFEVADLLQEGLELDYRSSSSRGVKRGARPGRDTPLWAVKDIHLRIVRPLETQPLPSGQNLQMHRLVIEGHEGFSAKGVRLSSSRQAVWRVNGNRPEIGGAHATDIDLATANTGKALDTIEFFDVSWAESVDAGRPLRLRIKQELPENVTIVPFGLDAVTGLYFPLGYTDGEGTILIQQMPDAEDGRDNGYQRVCRVYLQGFWSEKAVERGAGSSMLAIAEVTDETSPVHFITDQQIIRDRVATARRILLFIPGWLGDGRDKVRIIRRAQHAAGTGNKDLAGIYDLVLTFHYDSVGLPVEESARRLGKSLEAVGLGPEDGKTVHVLTHSTGGLVVRWLIEQEGGGVFVDHLVLVGCPNLGAPWDQSVDLAVFALGTLINFLPVPGLIGEVLGFLQEARRGGLGVAQQLQPGSDLLRRLNGQSGASEVPYTVIAGDSRLIQPRDEREEKIKHRYLDRFRGDYRKRLEAALFGEPNDDAITVRSMLDFPLGKERAVRIMEPLGSSHLGYFVGEAGVRATGEVLFELFK